MYFIGVSTRSSSICELFPRWMGLAGVPDAELEGIDIAVGAAPECYRSAVAGIRDDRHAAGALVTTHKVALYEHARDLFTDFNEEAAELGEVGCIVKRGERLSGLGLDTLTSGLALQDILGRAPFRGHALILGAGGAGVALAAHLEANHQPEGITLTDVSPDRLDRARRHTGARCLTALENDRLTGSLPPGSLIVNATGLGKDRPGSPISPSARFPRDVIAWDFNYRGELLFLDYARAQGARAVDGWRYFLHGWSQILSRVLGFELTPELFAAMRQSERMT